MSKTAHRIYIFTLVAIVVIVTAYLFYKGSNYYTTSLEERFYHQDHKRLKPSGPYGHGLGILGTLLILIGVFGYQARKYMRSLSKIWVLKHWLEFHIFLCTLGPIMVLFHTSFKFGGLVSISFWSMVAVVASGVLGRFIYLQIPRTMQGRELSLSEINDMKQEYVEKISSAIGQDKVQEILTLAERKTKSYMFSQFFEDMAIKKQIRLDLKKYVSDHIKINEIMSAVRNEMAISRKISRLTTMQKYFKYWHVAHLPFAIIMLVIMVIHVGVTLAFGYKSKKKV
jgi:hypothetical protein